MRFFLRFLGIIGDTLVLLLIITIVGISIFTIVNLTPGYKPVSSEPSILGVNQQISGDKGLVINKNLDSESIVRSLEVTPNGEDNFLISSTVNQHSNGVYHLPLIRVVNNYNSAKKIKFVYVGNDLENSNSTVYILINDQKYNFSPKSLEEMPVFRLDKKKSFDVGLFIESEKDINFVTEVRFSLKTAD